MYNSFHQKSRSPLDESSIKKPISLAIYLSQIPSKRKKLDLLFLGNIEQVRQKVIKNWYRWFLDPWLTDLFRVHEDVGRSFTDLDSLNTTGVTILPTQTIHFFLGNPSKAPCICILWSPLIGRMTPLKTGILPHDFLRKKAVEFEAPGYWSTHPFRKPINP